MNTILSVIWRLVKILSPFLIIIVFIGFIIQFAIGAIGEFFSGIKFPESPCVFDCEEPPPQYSPGPLVLDVLLNQGLLQTTRVNYNFSQIQITQPVNFNPDPVISYNAFVEVTGGINLDLITSRDIDYVDGTLMVYMPNSQAIDCILNEQDSYYYEEKNCDLLGTGVRFSDVCERLKDEARDVAKHEAAIADHSDLQAFAFDSAVDTLEPLLLEIEGVTDVQFEQQPYPVSSLYEEGTCKDYEQIQLEAERVN